MKKQKRPALLTAFCISMDISGLRLGVADPADRAMLGLPLPGPMAPAWNAPMRLPMLAASAPRGSSMEPTARRADPAPEYIHTSTQLDAVGEQSMPVEQSLKQLLDMPGAHLDKRVQWHTSSRLWQQLAQGSGDRLPCR